MDIFWTVWVLRITLSHTPIHIEQNFACDYNGDGGYGGMILIIKLFLHANLYFFDNFISYEMLSWYKLKISLSII